MNVTTSSEHYGILVPNSNGEKLIGKVVRIDLKAMVQNVTKCSLSYHTEFYDHHTNTVNITYRKSNGVHTTTHFDARKSSVALTAFYTSLGISSSCITVLDLSTLHPQAIGFRKGFTSGHHHGYLSPGEHSVAVQMDVINFSLDSVRMIDLSVAVDPTNGGYSGGFADGTWACFK